ncbi:hypothetical protein KKR94_p00325 (plasmid) [Klebsiella pneumoniae]|nr:hypothetical protein KKR94_p00325 [Klebsiella pneumoniae]
MFVRAKTLKVCKNSAFGKTLILPKKPQKDGYKPSDFARSGFTFTDSGTIREPIRSTAAAIKVRIAIISSIITAPSHLWRRVGY